MALFKVNLSESFPLMKGNSSKVMFIFLVMT